MKIRKEYLQKLKELGDLEFNLYDFAKTKIHHLNPKSKQILHEDVTMIQFTSLYANLLISLFDEGMIDQKWKEDIDRVRWFLKNRKELKLLPSGEYDKWKTHCNSLFMKIQSPYVLHYMDLFYKDFIQKYEDKIIYIDVDLIIVNIRKDEFKRGFPMEEIDDFSYTSESLVYFYIENMKRYIYLKYNGEIESKGIGGDKKTQLQSLIKSENRMRKLEKIGI